MKSRGDAINHRSAAAAVFGKATCNFYILMAHYLCFVLQPPPHCSKSVSYTHLDVYKRQPQYTEQSKAMRATAKACVW